MRAIRVLAVCLFAMLAVPSLLRPETLDKIMVVVNNEVITQGEIDKMLGPAYQHYKSMYQGDELIRKLDDTRQAILAQLIDEKLVLSEARKKSIEVDEKDVAKKMEEAQSRFGAKELFEKALAEQRLTPKELKNRFRDQLMARKLIDEHVGSRIIITPVDVSEYYKEHPEEFTQPEEVSIRCILIRATKDRTLAQSAELAARIREQLGNGADFGDLAKAYSEGPGASDGGMMGYKRRGDLLPDIENAVFGLKEGDVSEPVRSSLGIFIFKVDQKRAAKTMTFSEARRFIEEAIYKEKAKEKMKAWVENLKKHAYIAFK